MEEKKQEEPMVDNTVDKLKIKKRKKLKPKKDEVIKVDLSKPAQQTEENTDVEVKKPEENETKENNADDSGVVAESENADATQEQEEVQPEKETQEESVLEEIIEEKDDTEVEVEVEATQEQVDEAIAEAETTGKPIPENIQKLIDFMEETGGDLNDYVRLNQDYSGLDDKALLYEYYKQTKPHLNTEEINFLMEDQFSYDEDEDEERDIKRKKLALKEQVANAKSHLDRQKSKYYKEIKAGSKLTPEQQKAMDFFNRYNKESEETKKQAEAQKSNFLNKTNQVFNDKFKGFEYNVGDKKYRFKVNNANEVKEAQSDINNFVKKFLNEKNEMSDARGYHKSLYTAMNADAIAKHFYEQGKADAIKNSIAKAKNVDMNPRQSHGQIEAGGMKFKVLGDDSSGFKFKIKNKNK